MTSLDTDDQTGRVLGGRYRLITLVGSGASAHVYLAEDTNLRRRVAVKVLHPALAGDELFLKRFRTEARAAAVLNHPNIMAIHDWGYDDGPYLVSELLGGGSLRAMYDAGHVLSPSQALVVGLGAARGLEYAHGRQLVHRDIKPANLLFDDDGRLRIADFGLARALAEAATTEPAGSLVGTVRYASPEQAKGEKVSEKADVYSLALVLCEAVTGEVPFVADTTIGTLMARVDTPLEPPEELGPMRSVVACAGSLDPDDRPTAGELVTSLLAAAEDLPRPRPLPLAGAFADRDRAEREALDATMVAGVEAESRLASAADLDDLDDLDLGGAPSRRSGAASPPLTRRRAWPWVLMGLVLLALAGVGGWFAWDATRTPTHSVPALRGEEVQAAVATLSGLGFDVEVVDGRDDEIPPDFVIRTEPSEGETLAEGETIVVRRSLGPTTVPVPDDLVGLTVDDARVRLEAVELRVGEVTEVFDEELPEGQVVGVDLAATQTELPKGSDVPLLVSQGPEPRQIPDLAGQAPDEATATLEGLGLVVATDEAFSDSVDEGLVLAVQPEPGTEVERGGTVTLVVSLGPEPIPVPGVVGLAFDEARATLEGAGFDVNFSGDPDETICGQRPVAGETADRGATVSITTDC